MDDVYLLNSPFTFQAMEKHAAYCAMIRLGLKVPDHGPGAVQEPARQREVRVHRRAVQPAVRPREVAAHVGYPLFMKPYDGGAWRGVSRIRDAESLHRAYDESGEMLMHLQASVEGYDVFARSLSIGAETMVMKFDPDQPMHGRYSVSHDFLSPEVGAEVLSIGRDRQRVLPVGVQLLRDAGGGPRGPPDRLRERLPRRRDHVAALLLPVGDEGTASVVACSAPPPAASRCRTSTRRRGSRSPTAPTCPTTRSWPPTTPWRTATSTPSATGTSARPGWRPGRDGAGVLRVGGLRPGPGRDGHLDVPAARARPVRRALPWSARVLVPRRASPAGLARRLDLPTPPARCAPARWSACGRRTAAPSRAARPAGRCPRTAGGTCRPARTRR